MRRNRRVKERPRSGGVAPATRYNVVPALTGEISQIISTSPKLHIICQSGVNICLNFTKTYTSTVRINCYEKQPLLARQDTHTHCRWLLLSTTVSQLTTSPPWRTPNQVRSHNTTAKSFKMGP